MSVVVWGAEAGMHEHMETEDGEVDAGEDDVDQHHPYQVVGKLVSEGVPGGRGGVLVDNVDVETDGDIAAGQPVTGVAGIQVLVAAHQEEVVVLGGWGGDSEGEGAAVDQRSVVLVLADLLVVARDDAVQVGGVVLPVVATVVRSHTAVERRGQQTAAAAGAAVIGMVDLLPDGGRHEGQH